MFPKPLSLNSEGVVVHFVDFKPNPLAKYSRFASILSAWLLGACNFVWIGADNSIHFAWRNKAEILENALILDATAHKEIYHATLGDNLSFHEINVKQNLHVVQVSDELFSKHSLKNPARVAQLGGLATILNAGLITHKCAEDQLNENFPSHSIPTAHFMALRGINAMQDLDALVIAGRIEPPALAVEARARALWPSAPLDFTGSYEWQAGDYGGVAGHSDCRIDAVLQDMREGEMAQAIGRLRAVRSENTKLLIIATNAPCPLPVNQTITANELLPDYRFSSVAIRDRVFIMSDKWLSTKHPDLFGTANTAKCWLDRGWFKGVETLIYKLLLKGNDPLKCDQQGSGLQTVEFRVQGQRGSLAKAVVWTNDDTARNRIEQLTNKTVTTFISNESQAMKTNTQETTILQWAKPEFKVIPLEDIEPMLLARLKIEHSDIYDMVLPGQLLPRLHQPIISINQIQAA